MDKKRIICFGDSITWGYHPEEGTRISEENRWPCVLQTLAGDGYQVISEGQNSRTIATDDPTEGEKNGLRYIIPCIESHKPVHLLIILLGTNDMKTRYNYEAEDIAGEMQLFLEKVQAYNHFRWNDEMKMLLMAPPRTGLADRPSPMEEAFDFSRTLLISAELPAKYELLAKTYGCLFFDTSQAVKVSPADGVHLDPEGQAALGKAVYQFLRDNTVI